MGEDGDAYMLQNDVLLTEGQESHGGEHRQDMLTSDQAMEVEEMGIVEEEGNDYCVMEVEEAGDANATGSKDVGSWVEQQAREREPGGTEWRGPPDWRMTESRGSVAAGWAGSEAEIGSNTRAPTSASFSALRQASKKRGGEEEHQVGEPGDHSEREKIQKQGKCEHYDGKYVTKHGARGGEHRGRRSEAGEDGIRPHGGEQCRPQRQQRQTRGLVTTKGCEETRAGGALCQHALLCPNRLPTQAETKVEVAELPGQGRGVRASANIATGEIITGFGDTRVLTAETGGLALAECMQQRRRERTLPQFQYTYSQTFQDQRIWMIPREDVATAQECSHLPLKLKRLLDKPAGVWGVGQLISHTCPCPQHANCEVNLRWNQDEAADEDLTKLVLCVEATRPINKGEWLAWTYTEKDDLWFECRCCQCTQTCTALGGQGQSRTGSVLTSETPARNGRTATAIAPQQRVGQKLSGWQQQDTTELGREVGIDESPARAEGAMVKPGTAAANTPQQQAESELLGRQRQDTAELDWKGGMEEGSTMAEGAMAKSGIATAGAPQQRAGPEVPGWQRQGTAELDQEAGMEEDTVIAEGAMAETDAAETSISQQQVRSESELVRETGVEGDPAMVGGAMAKLGIAAASTPQQQVMSETTAKHSRLGKRGTPEMREECKERRKEDKLCSHSCGCSNSLPSTEGLNARGNPKQAYSVVETGMALADKALVASRTIRQGTIITRVESATVIRGSAVSSETAQALEEMITADKLQPMHRAQRKTGERQWLFQTAAIQKIIASRGIQLQGVQEAVTDKQRETGHGSRIRGSCCHHANCSIRFMQAHDGGGAARWVACVVAKRDIPPPEVLQVCWQTRCTDRRIRAGHIDPNCITCLEGQPMGSAQDLATHIRACTEKWRDDMTPGGDWKVGARVAFLTSANRPDHIEWVAKSTAPVVGYPITVRSEQVAATADGITMPKSEVQNMIPRHLQLRQGTYFRWQGKVFQPREYGRGNISAIDPRTGGYKIWYFDEDAREGRTKDADVADLMLIEEDIALPMQQSRLPLKTLRDTQDPREMTGGDVTENLVEQVVFGTGGVGSRVRSAECWLGGQWWEQRHPPAPIDAWGKLVLVVHIPLHWIAVVIWPTSEEIWICDPLLTYGSQYHRPIRDKVMEWVEKVEKAWLEAEAPKRNWKVVIKHWPQQARGSVDCAFFTALYAACATRGWEPPAGLTGRQLRAWAAEELWRAGRVELTTSCCKCGKEVRQLSQNRRIGRAKCQECSRDVCVATDVEAPLARVTRGAGRNDRHGLNAWGAASKTGPSASGSRGTPAKKHSAAKTKAAEGQGKSKGAVGYKQVGIQDFYTRPPAADRQSNEGCKKARPTSTEALNLPSMREATMGHGRQGGNGQGSSPDRTGKMGGPRILQSTCEWKAVRCRADKDSTVQARRLHVEQLQLTDEEQGQSNTGKIGSFAKPDPATSAARDKMMNAREALMDSIATGNLPQALLPESARRELRQKRDQRILRLRQEVGEAPREGCFRCGGAHHRAACQATESVEERQGQPRLAWPKTSPHPDQIEDDGVPAHWLQEPAPVDATTAVQAGIDYIAAWREQFINGWRRYKGLTNWQAICHDKAATLWVEHLVIGSSATIIRRLEEVGLRSPDNWASASLTEQRSNDQATARTTCFTAQVTVDETLRQVLQGEIVLHKGCEQTPRVSADPHEDAALLDLSDSDRQGESIIAARSAEMRGRLARMVALYKAMGTEESDLWSLLELNAECAFCDHHIIGRRWQWWCDDKPQSGREIYCPRLAAAMRHQTTFSAREWDSFAPQVKGTSELLTDVQMDDFIRTAQGYFRPVDLGEQGKGKAAPTPPTRLRAIRAQTTGGPRCLSTVWGSDRHSEAPGELCIMAKLPMAEAERDRYCQLCRISNGEEHFFGRKADVVNVASHGGLLGARHTNRIGMHRVPVSIGMPDLASLERWGRQQQGKPEFDEQMATWLDAIKQLTREIPPILRGVRVQAEWKARLLSSRAEEESAVCIRFQQRRAPSANVAMNRAAVRQGFIDLGNMIQRSLFDTGVPLTQQDVDVAGYFDRAGDLHAMVTLAKSKHRDIEEQITIGVTIAFFMCNRATDSVAAQFKWCPCARNIGESVCRVSSITRADNYKGRSRSSVCLGNLTAPDNMLPSQIVSMLTEKTAGPSPLLSMRQLGPRRKGNMPLAAPLPPMTGISVSDSQNQHERPPVQIVVRGFPSDACQEEILQLFDEHDVMILGYRRWQTEREEAEQVSEITFANPEDVTATLKRHRDKPFRVHGRVVKIAAVKSAPPGRIGTSCPTRASFKAEVCHMVHEAQVAPTPNEKPADRGPLWETWGIKTTRRETAFRLGTHVLATEDIGLTDTPGAICRGTIGRVESMGGWSREARTLVVRFQRNPQDLDWERTERSVQVSMPSEEVHKLQWLPEDGWGNSANRDGRQTGRAILQERYDLEDAAKSAAQKTKGNFWHRHMIEYARRRHITRPGALVNQGLTKMAPMPFASDWDQHPAYLLATFMRKRVAGLRWQKAGKTRPSGRNLCHEGLMNHLRRRLTLTVVEWEELGVREILEHDYVQIEDQFYTPEAGDEEAADWTQWLEVTGHTLAAADARALLAETNGADGQEVEGKAERTRIWELRVAAILEELEWGAGWRREAFDGNVITWNLGPYSAKQMEHQIRDTLRQGAPVVMLQELRFRKGDDRRTLERLKELDPEYDVRMERGPVPVVEARWRSRKWHSRQSWAVVTFLHKKAFQASKTQRREWGSSLQRQGLRHIARGRVQWLDTVTTAGKAVFLVNIHQATTQAFKLQESLWQVLREMIEAKRGMLGIMAGDFNSGPMASGLRWKPVTANGSAAGRERRCEKLVRALAQARQPQRVSTDGGKTEMSIAPSILQLTPRQWADTGLEDLRPGDYITLGELRYGPHHPECTALGGLLYGPMDPGARWYYTESSNAANAAADSQLADFVSKTGGRLIASGSPTRGGQLTEAKLDQLVVWELPTDNPEGRAEWIGKDAQDHARTQFRVGQAILGNPRPPASRPKSTAHPRIRNSRKIKPFIDAECESSQEALHRRAVQGDIDATEAKDLCQKRRYNASIQFQDGPGRRKGKPKRKLPHRDKGQQALRRAMMMVEVALNESQGSKRVTAATRGCLRGADLGRLEHELTEERLMQIMESRQWRAYLEATKEHQCELEQEAIEQQMVQCEKQLEEQTRYECLMDGKAMRRWTGKLVPQPNQTELQLPVTTGLVGIMLTTSEGHAAWQAMAHEVKTRAPNAVMRLHDQNMSMLKLARGAAAQHCVERAMKASRSPIGMTWEPGGKALSQGMTECQDPDICTAVRANPYKPDRGAARAKAWAGVTRNTVVWVGEEYYRPAQAEMLMVEGHPLGAYMMQGGRHVRTTTHDVWMLSQPRAQQLIIEWEIQLLQAATEQSELESWISRWDPSDMQGRSLVVATTNELGEVHYLLSRSEELMARGQWTWWAAVQSDGPWEGNNLTLAWEIYMEREGYSPHARCGNSNCQPNAPAIAVRVPSTSDGAQAPSRPNGHGAAQPEEHQEPPPNRPWRRQLPMFANLTGPHSLNMTKEMEALNEAWQHPTPNTCKTSASIPLATVDANRRELQGFCTQCWKFTDFRRNKNAVGCMRFMEDLGVFNHRLVGEQEQRLRGTLTEGEWQGFISKLRNGKSPGPDGFQNELLKDMTPTEQDILRKWANEVLSTGKAPRRMTAEELNGTVTMLHKGSDSTHLPNNWRPVVLLNSMNQLIGHVVESRLRQIVERWNVLEPGQGGYRQARSTDINMRKIEMITSKAQTSKSRFLRVDVDFSNAYNSMSQAALWALMRKFRIPDVDFLESLYEQSTVRMAPNDQHSATITFDTGVAQGSVLSPILFLIFINALARMLTAVGQKEGIAHGVKGVEMFNCLCFCDDMSIFAEDAKGIQRLMNVIASFEEWSGIPLNLKKTMLMIVDGDKQRRQRTEATTYQGQAIRTVPEHEPVRYLGFWATANGDFRHTKEIVRQRTREAVELIRHHPHSPGMAIQIFKSKGIGIFRYSAAMVDWTGAELQELQDLWTMAYRLAWRLPEFTPKVQFSLPKAQAGFEYPTPLGIMAETLSAHVQRGLMHEDVVKAAFMQALEEAKVSESCFSFSDLREEMKLVAWKDTRHSVWLRLAKVMSELPDMTVEFNAELLEEPEEFRVGWAKATRPLRMALRRVKQIEGRSTPEVPACWSMATNDQGDGGDRQWRMETSQWQAAQAGARIFKKVSRQLSEAGIRGPAQVEHQQLGKRKHSQAPVVPAGLRATYDADGQQAVRMVIERGHGITETDRRAFQNLLDLVDWKGLGVETRGHKRSRGSTVGQQITTCKHCAKPKYCFQECQSQECKATTADGLQWLQQLSQNERPTRRHAPAAEQVAKALHDRASRVMREQKCDQIGGKETQDLDEWTGISAQMGMFPVEIMRGVERWLWNARTQQGCTMEHIQGGRRVLRKGWEGMFQALHPRRARVWRGQNVRIQELLAWPEEEMALSEAEEMLQEEGAAWQKEQEWCKDMQTAIQQLHTRCDECQVVHQVSCQRCQMTRCRKCAAAWKQCPGCGGAMTGEQDPAASAESEQQEQSAKPAGELLARNIHNAGGEFIEEVTAVRQKEVSDPLTTPLDERAEFRGRIRGTDQMARARRIQELLGKTDRHLLTALVNAHDKDMLYIARALFPQDCPKYGGQGWWYKARTIRRIKLCPSCKKNLTLEDFETVKPGQWCGRCKICCGERTKKTTCNYLREAQPERDGLECVAADPRYISRADERSGGNVLLDAGQLRQILEATMTIDEHETEVWLTTSQMGYPLTVEEDEIRHWRDEIEGRQTGRWLAPQISAFIANSETLHEDKHFEEELRAMHAEWSVFQGERTVTRRQATIGPWESTSQPLVARDPLTIRDVDIQARIGSDWFFNEEVPRADAARGYVRVISEAVRWTTETEGATLLNAEGLVSNVAPEHPWSIMSAQWSFLQHTGYWNAKRGDLVRAVHREVQMQEQLDRNGIKSLTFRLMRSLQAVFEATTLIGGTMVTAPPFFETAHRGKQWFWGTGTGAAVVLWDTLTREEQEIWRQESAQRQDWILVRRQCKRGPKRGEDTSNEPPGHIILRLKRNGKPEDRVPGESTPPCRGRAFRERGWWSKGAIAATLNEYGLECWVHEKVTEGSLEPDRVRMVEASWKCNLEKDECQVRIDTREAHYWLGTEAGRIGAYGFQGQVSAADGADGAGCMGAGFCTLNLMTPGMEWEETDTESTYGGREIFVAGLTEGLKKGRPPNEQQLKSLQLLGLTWNDFVTAGDKIYKPKDRKPHGWSRVGREEEGTSSLRAELAALLQLILSAEPQRDLLALLDCQIEMTELRKWIGEGHRATLADKVNADILKEIIEALRRRVEAGAATFLVKVKAHRGEPLNERADDNAEYGRRQDTKEWNDRTDRILFRWTVKGEQSRRRAIWGPSARLAIKKQAAQRELQRTMAAATRKWGQEHWMGPDLCGKSPDEETTKLIKKHWWDPESVWQEVCTNERRKEGVTVVKFRQRGGKRPRTGQESHNQTIAKALKTETAFSSLKWQQLNTESLKAGDFIHTEGEYFVLSAALGAGSPVTDTWTADFLSREGESRECIGSYLQDKKVSWTAKRRLIQVCGGTFPTNKWCYKVGKGNSPHCDLCKAIGRTEIESVGHIQSAYCVGQEEVVTRAHNRCSRLIQKELERNVSKDENIRVLTADQEQAMRSLWEDEQLKEICPWDQLVTATHRAWGARQSANGTEGEDATADMENSEHETREETCSRCGADCRRAFRAKTQQAEAEDSGVLMCCACQQRRDPGWQEKRTCGKCWERAFNRRRLDGVVINKEEQRITIIEMKRTSDQRGDYWERADARATEQYADLETGLTECLGETEWQLQRVNLVVGTRSINTEQWNEAMKKLAMPKATWDSVRRKMMRILLEEFDTILKSYWAQKL